MNQGVLRRVAAIPLFLFVAPACGQSEESSGTSKEDFVEKAGAVCEAANEEFNGLFESDFPVLASKTPAFFQKAAPVIEGRQADLKKLEVPEGDGDEIASMIESGDMMVEDFKKAGIDVALATELFSSEGGQNSADFEEKAGAYGIEKCAADEGTPSEETEQPATPAVFSAEKQAYIAQADAVCKVGNDKLAPIEEEVFANSFPPTLEAWAAGLPRLLPVEQETLAEFKKIAPPAEDKAAIDKIVGQGDALFLTLGEAQMAAAAGDEAKLEDLLQTAFPAFDEYDQARRDYGFQECGSDEDA